LGEVLTSIPQGHQALTAASGFKLTEQQLLAIKLMGGPQRNTQLEGGARSQKTFTIVRNLFIRAMKVQSRHLITRWRNNSVWPSIGMDTIPKVCQLCFPGLRIVPNKQMGFYKFPNGSEIWLGGLDDGERAEKILGNEYASIYYNEASQIPYSSFLIAQTRLAQNIPGLMQRSYVDLNPIGKGHWTYALFHEKRDPVTKQPLSDPQNYAHLLMTPKGNSANLTPEYMAALEAMPERQRKRFLEGVYADETENALWSYEVIERNRRSPSQVPDLQMIVVSVDPSGAASSLDVGRDEIGITVVGLGVDGHGYLLADLTMLGSPNQWARTAVAAYHGNWAEKAGFRVSDVRADHIVAEVNYGGAMVENTLKTIEESVPYRQVVASRGKAIRAEPVSALYETNRFHHVGRFPELEDELCSFTNMGYVGGRSPNRADSLIWAASDLKLVDDAAQWLNFMNTESEQKKSGRPPALIIAGGELMEAYTRAYNKQVAGPELCAANCGKPLTGDRITDGVRSWHVGCHFVGA
jgi:hypothetical protein